MLYTVVPLERIYADPSQMNREKYMASEKTKSNDEAEYKEVILENGRIVTRRDGENYIIEKMNSTDMKDYLNEEYSPGKTYLNRQKE